MIFFRKRVTWCILKLPIIKVWKLAIKGEFWIAKKEPYWNKQVKSYDRLEDLKIIL